MRWPPLLHLFYLIPLLTCSQTLALPVLTDGKTAGEIHARTPSPPLSTRNVCLQQFKAAGPREGLKEVQTGFNLRSSTINCFKAGRNQRFFNYNDGDDKAEELSTPGIPPNAVCDHIMELQILNTAMELKNGPCDQLVILAKSPSRKNDQILKDAIKVIQVDIFNLINGFENLAFVSNILDKQKALVMKSTEGPHGRLPQQVIPPIDDDVLSGKNANLINRLKAVNDYLTKTKLSSRGIASQIDEILKKTFPLAKVKVSSIWTTALFFANSVAETPTTVILKAVEEAVEASGKPQAPATSSTPPAPSSAPGSKEASGVATPKANEPSIASGPSTNPPAELPKAKAPSEASHTAPSKASSGARPAAPPLAPKQRPKRPNKRPKQRPEPSTGGST